MSLKGQTPFGMLLKRLRLAAGLTQEGLAERTGLSAKAISELERDPTRTPRLSSVTLLADALQLNVDERAALQTAARPDSALLSKVPLRQTLPRPLTPLIGRADETAALLDMLGRENHRLITVTGTGGVGKTRLALHVAEQVANQFADGVFFVDLAPLRDPALVLGTIAQRFGVDDRDEASLTTRIRAVLHTKHLLLLIDNVEHLIKARQVLVELLEACPTLVFLVTSRMALRVRGEYEFRVGPLMLPPEKSSAEMLIRSPAGALFAERARAAGSDVASDPMMATTIAAICHRLDGLPLALELAAVWLPFLPPPTLLARLDHRLAMLDRGPHDLPIRQQTMRNAIAWSYDLLDTFEQTLCRRLSVFAGGWTIEAAVAVCGNDDRDLTMTQALASLVDKGLLLVQEPRQVSMDMPRMAMLETIREFAWEKLLEEGEELAVRRRHYDYYLTLAHGTEAAYQDAVYEDWLDRLQIEHDNLRLALEWCLTVMPEAGIALAGNLWRYWRVRGYHSEGRHWLEQFVQLAREPSASRVRALIGLGALFVDIGDDDAALPHFTQGLQLARLLGDGRYIGLALTHLATLARREARDEVATSLLDEALSLFREEGYPWEIALCLRELGNVARSQGDYARARAMFEESLTLSRQLGSKRALAWVLGDLALLRRFEGDDDQARSLLQESVSLYRAGNDLYDVPWALARLGDVVRAQGDIEYAKALIQESVGRFQQIGTTAGTVMAMYFMGAALSGQVRHQEAVRLFAAATAHDRARATLNPLERMNVDAAIDGTRRALGQELFDRIWAEGQRLPLEEASSYISSIISSI